MTFHVKVFSFWNCCLPFGFAGRLSVVRRRLLVGPAHHHEIGGLPTACITNIYVNSIREWIGKGWGRGGECLISLVPSAFQQDALPRVFFLLFGGEDDLAGPQELIMSATGFLTKNPGPRF